MITLSNAEWFFSLIILVVVYYISVVINGIVQTYMALIFGDSTAEEIGYLTPNPLVYFDPLSFIFLVLFHLGLPVSVPINPFNIKEPYKILKMFFLHFTESFVSIFLAFFSLAIAVFAYGDIFVAKLANSMFFTRTAPLKEATIYFTEHSSLSIVLALILISFVFLNIFMAAFSLIFNGVRFILILGFEKGYKYIAYADYLFIFGSYLIILFFADPLRYYLLRLILWSACKIAHLFGV